jgi:peptidoglycan/LPS O-acetylase OafA/YrhL
MERINYLDGWRGLAIILVLQSHFLAYELFSNTGRLGVDLFFSLSGLLMANILFLKKTNLKIFYFRRFSRIYPVFFIFVTVIFLYSFLIKQEFNFSEYFFTLVFLRTYLPTEPNIWSLSLPLGHLWSLNVEEHAYIIMSLITLLFMTKKRSGFMLIALGIVSILIQLFYVISIKFLGTPYFLYEPRTEVVLSTIFLSAGYHILKEQFNIASPPWLVIITFVLSICCYLSFSIKGSQWLIAPFTLAFTVNHLNDTYKTIKNMLSRKWLRNIGLWSFSIYLWQHPFFYYFSKFGNIFPYSNLLGLMLSIIVGYYSFKYIENPSRNMLNQWSVQRNKR